MYLLTHRSVTSLLLDGPSKPHDGGRSLLHEMDVSAATVAESLRSEATRIATLDALEALAPPIPSAVALAAAPALVDVLATEKERAAFDRCGLLLARLLAEAAPEPAPVFGTALGGGRFAAILTASLVAEAVQRAASSSGQPLTVEDARSYECLNAYHGPSFVRGMTAPFAAAGYTVMESMVTVRFIHTAQPRLVLLLPPHFSFFFFSSSSSSSPRSFCAHRRWARPESR